MTTPVDTVVVGATGAVGAAMLQVLADRGFPVGRLRVVASSRSAGGKVTFRGRELTLEAPSAEVFRGSRLALFSAGASVSREWGPVAAREGCLVVDNSSAFRMDPEVPLVVPEVNPQRIPSPPRGIIANPNCSTIQLMVALKPLHDAAGLEHVVVSTYQAISGKGARAVAEFDTQVRALLQGEPPPVSVLPGVLAGNLLCDWKHEPNGFSEEELKMVAESQKILELPGLRVSPTCVRVPVRNAHSESVWARFSRPLGREEALAVLRRAPGVLVSDAIGPGKHPQPREVSGQDEVFVGRVREDLGDPQALSLWVVGDNLRKGAATNAVQIAERYFQA
ncbi:MAG: aspartate-semialdehyde dehydrogenase [Deltaproteobacteria bacterium]|nr:aspartate-semialdehyde dehydrogenase [Deltaproteobacteria bacterium]